MELRSGDGTPVVHRLHGRREQGDEQYVPSAGAGLANLQLHWLMTS